jgi:predicted regulator of Ras-like GTPase activity (Roadblock/LC7/MglB family)
MKVKMFGYLKSVLRKWVLTPDEGQAAPVTSAASAPGHKLVVAPAPGAVPANGGQQNRRGIDLPLQPILTGLPVELQPHLKSADAGTLTLCVPLDRILAQLSRGSIRVPFGELRQAAPALFTPDEDCDGVMVALPLAEVLPRLNPALLARRRPQKKVEIPAEISSPFDKHNRSLVFSVGPAKPESAPTATPPPRQVVTAAPAPVTPAARSNLAFAPTPPPPGAPAPSLPPASPAPSLLTAGPAPISMPSGDVSFKRPDALPQSAATAPPATAAPAPAPLSAKSPCSAEPLLIGLTSLAESWPEALRQELVQMNLAQAKVALPMDLAERALKQGRIAFTWKTLRSWLKPAPAPSVSAHDSTVLELPLKIVAPLFLARQKEASKLKKQVVVDQEIPNLFFGFPQKESGGTSVGPVAVPAAPKPPDTNFYSMEDNADRASVQAGDGNHAPSPGTKFVAKYSTPNEVVSRAAALDGVAGALIALPDGLMVASRLPADLNGDTLAAFLPQIFGKVSQCTKELRMGELNNVNFTVGNIPWKIFRVNAIFFAAFGRAGEPLPTAQLAALATELDHRPK